MSAFVALLRGINVGKAKRVPMAQLRMLMLALGYPEAATLLNSGNVVFTAPQGSPASHARAISAAIAQQFRFEVVVVVISGQELAEIIAANPFPVSEAEQSRFLVAFVQDARLLVDLAPIGRLVVPPEQFALGAHAAYLHCASGILESAAGKALLGKAAAAVTSRNWATVLKLQALSIASRKP
jgi:uncharacterized protein (DUF1697 family)